MRVGRPFVRALVTYSWLERAPGAQGRRRRAARVLSKFVQPKKSNSACALFGSSLQPKHAPSTHWGGFSIHRAVFALWNAPIQRLGLLRFVLSTIHIISKSDVALPLFGTARHRWWSWSQFSRSAHCERPAEDASSCAMARASLTAPRTSMSCRLLRTSSRLSVLFLE